MERDMDGRAEDRGRSSSGRSLEIRILEAKIGEDFPTLRDCRRDNLDPTYYAPIE
jgi:hypothetical protein